MALQSFLLQYAAEADDLVQFMVNGRRLYKGAFPVDGKGHVLLYQQVQGLPHRDTAYIILLAQGTF